MLTQLLLVSCLVFPLANVRRHGSNRSRAVSFMAAGPFHGPPFGGIQGTARRLNIGL
jgi:hypothetical protein